MFSTFLTLAIPDFSLKLKFAKFKQVQVNFSISFERKHDRLWGMD
jgi:hypothetical protein